MSTRPTDIARLAGFLSGCGRVVALTGAGCSTASGIPDYRAADGSWKRAAPVMIQDFIARPETRQRYWARSQAGWPRFHAAMPNAAHRALAALEQQGLLTHLITQNVDGLHQRAGSHAVTELHGNLDRVHCLACGAHCTRAEIQHRLEQDNRGVQDAPAPSAPDGDADLDPARIAGFRTPECLACGGMLKPGVVFFGESVAASVVQRCTDALDDAGALLCIGTSLTVYSGFRFCRHAAARGIPIIALNRGRTRADELLSMKLDAPCGPVLASLAGHLCGTPPCMSD